jgi:hypothetical protein
LANLLIDTVFSLETSKLKKKLQRLTRSNLNEGESAASFCHQLAALFPDMFRNFYLVKNHKIVDNLTTTKARKKLSKVLESLEF